VPERQPREYHKLQAVAGSCWFHTWCSVTDGVNKRNRNLGASWDRANQLDGEWELSNRVKLTGICLNMWLVNSDDVQRKRKGTRHPPKHNLVPRQCQIWVQLCTGPWRNITLVPRLIWSPFVAWFRASQRSPIKGALGMQWNLKR
jgi:hypothetical protein